MAWLDVPFPHDGCLIDRVKRVVCLVGFDLEEGGREVGRVDLRLFFLHTRGVLGQAHTPQARSSHGCIRRTIYMFGMVGSCGFEELIDEWMVSHRFRGVEELSRLVLVLQRWVWLGKRLV